MSRLEMLFQIQLAPLHPGFIDVLPAFQSPKEQAWCSVGVLRAATLKPVLKAPGSSA